MRFLVYCGQFFTWTWQWLFWGILKLSIRSWNGRIFMPNFVTLMKYLWNVICRSYLPKSHLFKISIPTRRDDKFEIYCRFMRDDAMTKMHPLISSPITATHIVKPTLWLVIRNISEEFQNTMKNGKIQMRHARAWNLSKSAFHLGDPKPHYSNTTQPMTHAVWNFYLLLFSGWMENTEKIH